MKKIFILILSIFVLQFANAQSSNTATVTSVKDFQKEKFNDHFTFKVSNAITSDQIKENERFYTDFFKVTFNSERHILTFKMNDKDTNNRKIIRRMFAGLNIEQVDYDGQSLTVDDFFNRYMYSTDEIPMDK